MLIRHGLRVACLCRPLHCVNLSSTAAVNCIRQPLNSRTSHTNFTGPCSSPLASKVQMRSFSLWGSSSSTQLPPVPTTPNNLPLSDVMTKALKDEELTDSAVVLPDPPAIPEPGALLEPLNTTLEDFGLGSPLSPAAYVRHFIVWSQAGFDSPWWLVIVCCSLTIRIATLPFFIAAQKNAALMSEHGPKLNKILTELKEAQTRGDHLLMAEKAMDMEDLKKKTGFKISRLFTPMLGQGFAFASVFIALRAMTAVSFPGFETGGCLWFTNLCACDPWLLPAINSLSMYYILKKGVETGFKMDEAPGMSQRMSNFLMYGGPIIIFFAGKFYFPSAMVFYWVISNFISIIFGRLMRTAKVRKFLKLPPMPPQKKAKTLSEKWKKFNFKKSVDEAKRTCVNVAKFMDPRTVKTRWSSFRSRRSRGTDSTVADILADDVKKRAEIIKKSENRNYEKPLVSREELDREDIIKRRLRRTTSKDARAFTPGELFDPNSRMNK